MAERSKIVVLGGGFAGVATARELAKLLPREDDCDIVLVDRNNYLLFTPMLTELVGGDIDAEDTVVSIRRLSPRITFLQGRVTSIDTDARSVTVETGEAARGIPVATQTLEAAHLVIALGSEANYHGISGLEENSLSVNSVGDAAETRRRALALLERANAETDGETRRALLTFVVGGGGFSGVETMAALNDLVRDSLKFYPAIQPNEVTTIIVQPGKRLLPEIGDDLAAFAQKELEKRAVKVALNTKVVAATSHHVQVDPPIDGRKEVPTHLLVWAGGVEPSPAIGDSKAKLGKHHGLVVDSCCAVVDHPSVWALGDCAEIPKPNGKGTYAPTAQNAMREGPLVAHNIVARMRGGQPQPFDYSPIGELALVGKRSGVASVYGVHVSGLPAWMMWRAVYLAKMPRMSKRLRIGASWLLDLAFGREVTELR